MRDKTTLIHFVKMHGCGNDYIFVDAARYAISDPCGAAIALSDRHFGIGSDGLVLIGRSESGDADFTMRIFNADGSEGLMCGNASRCVGKLVYERGLTSSDTVRLLTLSGVKTLRLRLDGNGGLESVTVDMGEPRLADASQFAASAEALPAGVFVSMGNPHYVVFVDDVDKVDVSAEGSRLERHPSFPQRCNIEFAQITDKGLRLRVWERGSGITLACGTGACAAAVAAAVTGMAGRCSRVVMDGGALDVEWSADDRHVYLTGDATIVYEGDIALPPSR